MIENFLSENNCIISNKIIKPAPILPTPVLPNYITFEDSIVKQICVENWGTDGEITYEQVAAVTDLGLVFNRNTQITRFDELQYFINLGSLSVIDDGRGMGTFEGCTNLTSIIIPNSVTEIGYYAFAMCESLISIIVPNSLVSIGEASFAFTALSSFTIPNSVTSVDEQAFQACVGLSSIIIPNSVISIGSSIFEGCTNLTSIIIPNSISVIPNYAFVSNTGLTSITLPNSITSIGVSAFNYCSELISITVETLIPPSLGSNVFFGVTNLSHIYVPATSVDTYKTAAGWNVHASKISAIV